EMVGLPQLSASGLAGGMAKRCRRPLHAGRPIMKALGANAVGSERRDSLGVPGRCGHIFDLGDQGGHSASVRVRREVRPGGKWAEDQGLHAGVPKALEGLSATPSGVLAGPVEPETFQNLLSEHGPDGVDARPILGPSDESFLAPLGEDVLQALALGSVFMGHQDRVVSPRPEFLAPVGEATGLAGEIGVQVAHEPGELLGVIDGEKQMEVVGKKGEGANSDGVETLRASQDADDEGVELGRWAEKEASVEGPAGDLHERTALGNEAQSSHSWYRRKTGSEI